MKNYLKRKISEKLWTNLGKGSWKMIFFSIHFFTNIDKNDKDQIKKTYTKIYNGFDE